MACKTVAGSPGNNTQRCRCIHQSLCNFVDGTVATNGNDRSEFFGHCFSDNIRRVAPRLCIGNIKFELMTLRVCFHKALKRMELTNSGLRINDKEKA